VPGQAAVEFLSTEWFSALAAALAHLDAREEAPIALGLIVTDVTGPAGREVRYTISVGGGQPARLILDSPEDAEVTLVAAYPDALALATGEATAASLLAAGRIKIRGDVARLVEAATSVEAAGAAVRQLHRIVT